MSQNIYHVWHRHIFYGFENTMEKRTTDGSKSYGVNDKDRVAGEARQLHTCQRRKEKARRRKKKRNEGRGTAGGFGVFERGKFHGKRRG